MRTLLRAFLWTVIIVLPGYAEQPPARTEMGPPGDDPSAVAKLQSEIVQLRELVREQGHSLEIQQNLLRDQQRQLSELTDRVVRQNSGNGQESTTPRLKPAVLVSNTLSTASTIQAPPAQAEMGARVEQLEKGLTETKRSLEERIGSIGPFSFSGDFRIRYEPFFGGGPENADAPPARHRERYRVRLNANAKFDDEFAGGLSLASGEAGDPISTNQTLTGFFTRKPFLLDRAFVTYTPRWLKPLRITAGKWAYTWYRTEMTWDNDVNPEGLSESLTFNWNDSFLRRLTAIAFQLPFFEVSGGPDSAIFGGQLQTDWTLQPRVRLGTYVAYYGYRQANSIAANHNNGTGAFSGSASTGFGGNYGFGGGTFTNYSGTINGVRTFASKFGVVDAVARVDLDTGVARWPVMLQLNFAQNTRTCQNLGAFSDAGVGVPACNPRDRQAYWAEAQFGRNIEKGDLRLGYTLMHIERDAVVSSFNFSDMRQATNVVNHRLEFFYQLNRNATVGLASFIGRQLGGATTSSSSTSVGERYLKRLQLDLLYRF